jgi:DNA-damage-inducible protein J
MATRVKKNISIKVDSELRKEAEAVLDDMGITMSSLFTMTLKKIVADRKLPFTPSARPTLQIAKDEIAQGDIDRFETASDWKEQTLNDLQD